MLLSKEELLRKNDSDGSLIATLTLNPCIDRSVRVSGILPGGTNRVLGSRQDVSGKGINVSIALKHLRMNTVCLGFNFSGDRILVERELDRQEIAHDFVTVEGRLRMNIKLFDQSRKEMTEFNERGEMRNSDAIETLLSKIEGYLERLGMLVISGSAPEGVPSDLYRRIIEKANQKGVRCILDASGPLLAEGIKAKPYLIKPNLDELEGLFGEKLKGEGERIQAARTLNRQGIQYVCLSLGKDGAMLIGPKRVCVAKAPDVDVRGVQGAGDSLVAGICLAMSRGVSQKDMLRYATAAAGASLRREGTQMCSMEDFLELLEQVEIREIGY